MTKAIVMLEDGTFFEGTSFGAEGESYGEVVFNTSMSGYQEIITDPSYRAQIVTMTYPLIGNYGTNLEDLESDAPQVAGFIVKELSPIDSNWRSTESLSDYLKKYNVIGLEGIDTRALVIHLRDKGAMRAILSTVDFDNESLHKKVLASPPMSGRDLVKEVSISEPEKYVSLRYNNENIEQFKKEVPADKQFNIVAYDFGIKRNILDSFVKRGCDVTLVPATYPAEDVMKLNPDGVFLSNGPGDPDALPYIYNNVKNFFGNVPVFGICLGHQLLGLAFGGKTYKLKFGHRGGNHPVKNLRTGKIEITSQNHGFCVDPDTLDTKEVEMTHFNLYDGTVEGFRHKKFPCFCVQYHPEACPGPHDSAYLFDDFIEMITEWKKRNA